MGKPDRREYMKSARADDFIIIECPNDSQFQAPFLPIHSRHGSKALAGMSLSGSFPIGAVVKQCGDYYLHYDGVLYALDANKDLIDEIPRFYPELDHNGEGRWTEYES